MTAARLWRVLVVLAGVVVGGYLFAMAHYHGDSPTPTWEFEVGIAVFRYGVIVLVVAALGAGIWGAFGKRRPP